MIVTLFDVVVVETVVEGEVHKGGVVTGATDAMGVVFAMTASSLDENAQVVTKQFGAQLPSPLLIYQAVAKVSKPSDGLSLIFRSVSRVPPLFQNMNSYFLSSRYSSAVSVNDPVTFIGVVLGTSVPSGKTLSLTVTFPDAHAALALKKSR